MKTPDRVRRADTLIFFQGGQSPALQKALRTMLTEATSCDQADLDDKRAPCFGVKTLVDRRLNFLDELVNSMMPAPYRSDGNLLHALPASTLDDLECILDRGLVQ